MAQSYHEVVSDGTLSSLLLSIDFFERDDIVVTFDGVPNALPWTWVGTTGKLISFVPNVPNGVVVRATRNTEFNAPRHEFSLGAAFTEQSMDENMQQILFIAQEAREGGWGEAAGDVRADFEAATGSLLVGHTRADTTVVSVGAELLLHEQQLADLSDPAAGKGASLVAVEDAGAYFDDVNVEAVLQSEAARSRKFVTVTDWQYLVVGGDWTSAIKAAASLGRRVYIPAGNYLCAVDELPSGAYLFGDGAGSVLQPLTPESRGAITINSADASSFIDDLTFRDLKFLGTVAADGFSEQKHLLTLNGVRNALVENCRFEGFRGDGLYIGSGDAGGVEKHNFDVVVRRCHFDGVNNDNRQGISIIDCDGLTITENVFENCTRSNMPGAIDIEPDAAAYHIVKNIRITENKFKNIGGNLGVISLFLPSSVVPAPNNVLIADNEFIDSITSTGHAEIFLGTNRTLADADTDMGIIVRGNRGRNGSRALDIRAVKGVDVINNRFESYQNSNLCGQAVANQAPRKIVYRDNRFIKNGSSGGIGMEIFTVDFLTLENNLFDDCGSGLAGSYAIDFNAGTSSYVSLINNVVRTPTGKTLIAVQKEAGHTFTPATNASYGNVFSGLASNFQFSAAEQAVAVYSTAFQDWTPVISNAGAAITGMTAQNGKWSKNGRRVDFNAKVVWTGASPTGSQIYMTIPTPNSTGGNLPDFVPMTCAGNITVAAGAQVVCLLSTANQRLQFYTLNAGVLAALTLPSAGTVYISGSYEAA